MVLKQLYLKVNPGKAGPFWGTLLLLVALFPFGWLADKWPGFNRLAEFLFSSEAAHVLGHLILFCLVGTALLVIYPSLSEKVNSYLILILVVGILQESLQLVTFKQRLFRSDELLDIAVDLLGALAALKLFQKTVHIQEDRR